MPDFAFNDAIARQMINQKIPDNNENLVSPSDLRAVQNAVLDVQKESLSSMVYKEVTTFIDGSPMSDSKVDGFVYKKNGSKYFQKVFKVLNPEDFGAVGGGIVDDTAALNAFLACPFGKLEFTKTSYLVSGELFCNLSEVDINGNGAVLIPMQPNPALQIAGFPLSKHVFNLNNRATKKTVVTGAVNVVKGVKALNLPNVADISIGDILEVNGDFNHNINGVEYKYGHISEIVDIQGTVVFLNITPQETFSSLSYKVYTPSRNVSIRGLKIKTGDRNVWAFSGQKIIGLKMDRCNFEGDSQKSEVGAIIGSCIGVDITDCKVNGYSLVGDVQQLGYGFAISGHNITIEKCKVKDAKHCLTAGSRNYLSTGLKYKNNELYGADVVNGNVLDFHGNCRGIAENNDIYAIRDTGCVNVRDGGIDIIRNRMYITRNGTGENIRAIYFGEMFFGNSEISGNRVYIKTTSLASKVAVIEMNTPSEVRVRNFTIKDNYSNNGIYSLKRCDSEILIKDNVLENEDAETGYFPGIIATDCKSGIARNNTFKNNFGSTFNYTMQIDADSKIDFIENKVFRLPANTSPTVRIYSLKNKIVGNDIYLDTAIGGGGIVDYTTEKENFISNNNRVTSAGVRSILTYTALPSATDFFLGLSIQLSAGGNIKNYFVDRIGATYQWIELASMGTQTVTFTGNGTTTMSVAHGLAYTPAITAVVPLNTASNIQPLVNANGTNFNFTFAAANSSNLSYNVSYKR